MCPDDFRVYASHIRLLSYFFKHGSAENKRISIADSRKGGRRGGKWRRGKASGKGEEQGEGEKGRGKEI